MLWRPRIAILGQHGRVAKPVHLSDGAVYNIVKMGTGAIGAVLKLVARFALPENPFALAQVGRGHQRCKVWTLVNNNVGFAVITCIDGIGLMDFTIVAFATHVINLFGGELSKKKNQESTAECAGNFGKCHRV